jgi:transcriptional regulator MraZ
MCHSLRVDQKGRLKIPMTLLAALKGSGSEFYVTSDDGNAVRIYPMKIWKEVEERLERLCFHNANSHRLLARVKYFGQAVTIDKQTRLLIPIVLRKSAHMKGDVDVLTYANYLEVWNHARLMNDLMSKEITTPGEISLDALIFTERVPWAGRRKKKGGNSHGGERQFAMRRSLLGNSRGQPSHEIRGAQTDRTDRARVA